MADKTKVITLEELKQHKDEKSLWIAIYDNVYDITKFAAEHPGGEEVLQDQAGKDGTAAFEDVGHSSDARDMMKQYQIGVLADNDREVKKIKTPKSESSHDGTGSSLLSWLFPVGLAILAVFLFRYFGSSSSESSE